MRSGHGAHGHQGTSPGKVSDINYKIFDVLAMILYYLASAFRVSSRIGSFIPAILVIFIFQMMILLTKSTTSTRQQYVIFFISDSYTCYVY